MRDEVSLIFSGGIAMAEHVPKAMICGADLTAIDMPFAYRRRRPLYEEPEKLLILPDGLGKIPVKCNYSEIRQTSWAPGIRSSWR